MKAIDLNVSNVSISEEAYNSDNSFTLSDSTQQSLSMNVMDLEDEKNLIKIKEFFSIENQISEIRAVVIAKISELASIGVVINEGETYQEELKNQHEKNIKSLDMA
jgi:hypothetical protein